MNSWFPRTRGDRPVCLCQWVIYTRSGFPRTRGDRPFTALSAAGMTDSAASCYEGSPAHAGIDRSVHQTSLARRRDQGSPAHAGIDPGRFWRTSPPGKDAPCRSRRWFPRTRGDRPDAVDYAVDPQYGIRIFVGFPRTRGDRPNPGQHTAGADVRRRNGSPAHAGIDPSKRLCGQRGSFPFVNGSPAHAGIDRWFKDPSIVRKPPLVPPHTRG